jgi:CBS domain-containing protein
MKVEEIMTKDPAYATINTSLHEVAQKMADNDCGLIPVLEAEENRKLVGVITDRDLALRTIAHNKNPLQMVAGEVMTDAVITVKPEMSVEDCIATMERNRIRRVLVVDESENLNGIVAQADIARMAPPLETGELVKDVSA